MTGCIRRWEEISAEMTPAGGILKFSCGLFSRPSFEPFYSRGYTKVSQQVLH